MRPIEDNRMVQYIVSIAAASRAVMWLCLGAVVIVGPTYGTAQAATQYVSERIAFRSHSHALYFPWDVHRYSTIRFFLSDVARKNIALIHKDIIDIVP